MELIILLVIAYVVYWLHTKYHNKKPSESTLADLKTKYTSISNTRINVKRVDISDLTLSEEQKAIFDIIENTNENAFITGKAGTGKSALLEYFRQKTTKKVVVCAPTGVAALNVGGQTIHSLFKIPPAFVTTSKLKPDGKTTLLLKNIDAVVIDEISMVRVDLMDAVDHILKTARGSNLPFGGVQIIMFGDLYQLPPVVEDRELHKYFADNFGGFYFFNANVWENTPLNIYELTTIFRQKDEIFKLLLNEIRTGSVNDNTLNMLNKRANTAIPEDGVITLTTTNNTSREINSYKLAKLKGNASEYKARISGDLERSVYPTEELLQLKKGAQVMFLKNDKQKRWANGTVGFVESLTEDEIRVKVDNIPYSVPQETWSKIKYFYNQGTRKVEEEVVSSFTQFPLKLAWAITIHKSQGQTYETVAVDMGSGAFAHGQTYVALSRCESLERLYLKREVLIRDIIVDPTIIEFMKTVKITKTDTG
ncbi:AAA family ATPase [Patescibacteria group bacterium]|nr:AAA family ATPase [Patescibacteria group bacterium]